MSNAEAIVPYTPRVAPLRRASDPTTMMLDDPIDYWAEVRSFQTPPIQPTIYRVVVRSEQPPNVNFGKEFWQTVPIVADADIILNCGIVTFEGSVEEIGLPEDTVPSTVQWPNVWSQPDIVGRSRRGISTIDHQYAQLFEANLEIRSAALPQWRPFISARTHRTSDE